MSRRGGAVHVSTTTRRYRGRVYQTHLLRRSFREGAKVKHETLGNLSHLPLLVIDLIRRSLQGEQFVSAQDSLECLRSLPAGHVTAVLGTVRRLGLDRLIVSRRSRQRDLVVAMLAARILEPASKLATARNLGEATAFSTLGDALDVASATEDELYAAMDWLLPRQTRIQQQLAQRHLTDNTLVLYDVTSTYFEGCKCPLAKRGHSRDLKKGKLQIVIGLLCTREGCPIAIEVFEGNTGDPKTVAAQVRKLRAQFGLERVVLVGDRGMITQARIREDLRTVEGLCWISALRGPSIRKLVEDGDVQPSLYDDTDLAEITSERYPGERLIVCRNPRLQAERARKRHELLEATDHQLERILAATQRRTRPLRGRQNIGVRVGRVLHRFNVGKHYQLEITDETLRYTRRASRIEAEAALDGFYVVRTNVSTDLFAAPEVVRAYKDLSKVERAFRSLKTVDLKIRPIYHRLEKRVRAHVFLCMLAYYVEWHMRRALAPMLFEDDDRDQANAMRRSIVAPAPRSERAQEKARTKETDGGHPVHSFQTLLKDLATITQNLVRPTDHDVPPFTMVTTPTPLQTRAFELLQIPHRL